MKYSYNGRIRFFTLLIAIFALILLGKLYLVQVVRSDYYLERAERQYLSQSQKIFDRGSIYFETKEGEILPAADLKTGYILSINPKEIIDADKLWQVLSIPLEIDKDDFYAKANKKEDPYEEIARRLDKKTADAIENLALPGVGIYKEKWRYYPAQRSASHVLGILGYRGDQYAGRYGLENYYNDTLERKGGNLYSNFFSEIFANIKTVLSGGSKEGDLVTTIEPSVQATVEKEIAKIQTKWQPRAIGALIMNPNNGEIIAMAGSPNFDPNSFQGEQEVRVFSNPLVENVYEMGSIIKALTLAAGLDAGAVTAQSKYKDEGFLILNNSKISNHDGKGRGEVNMQTVLNESLNTGAAYVALKLGGDKFSKYFKQFGLGDETGIDLPNEVQGLIDNLESPREIEHATASYGQGIALTPIATARALSALGNGGYLPNPHIVKKINYEIGVSKTLDFGDTVRVIKKETSEEITRMLVNVVDVALKKGAVKMPRYSIAAKTGTAQMPNEKSGGYYDDRYVHSFFGYFPAYNPEFLVFIFMDDPQGVKYASETLTDPFMDIAKFLINYYNIPPDR